MLMLFLCRDLVFIWCRVYLRVKASKEDFLQECKHLILSATNAKAIFPFIKAIQAEVCICIANDIDCPNKS